MDPDHKELLRRLAVNDERTMESALHIYLTTLKDAASTPRRPGWCGWLG